MKMRILLEYIEEAEMGSGTPSNVGDRKAPGIS